VVDQLGQERLEVVRVDQHLVMVRTEALGDAPRMWKLAQVVLTVECDREGADRIVHQL
jgi:hypothetical protein